MKILNYLALLLLFTTCSPPPEPPPPSYPAELPEVPAEPAALGRYVAAREAGQPLRADNEARIVWADSAAPARTALAIVYLHGFGGSYRDGYPVNAAVADSLGANLYLARWGEHGQTADSALVGFTAAGAWADAREALAIGRRLGRRVIVMSTSTGGTLGLKLAAEFPDDVAALVNMGPNIEDDMPGAFLLNSPWGMEIAHLVSLGERRRVDQETPRAAQYFDTIYPAEALVHLQQLVGTTMVDSTFARVRCPVQTLYYHRDLLHEDEHVEISVYPEVHRRFATPADHVELLALPTPETHFIGSDIKSKDTETPRREILRFLRRVMD